MHSSASLNSSIPIACSVAGFAIGFPEDFHPRPEGNPMRLLDGRATTLTFRVYASTILNLGN